MILAVRIRSKYILSVKVAAAAITNTMTITNIVSCLRLAIRDIINGNVRYSYGTVCMYTVNSLMIM